MPNDAMVTKMLLIGDSGSGKTGATYSLLRAGYNLRFLDFDNGAEIVEGFASEEEKKRLSIVPLQDHFKPTMVPVLGKGGEVLGQMKRSVPSPTAWIRAVDALYNWEFSGEKLGSIYEWTPKDVLILDSLTHANMSAMAYVQGINRTLGRNPSQPEWGANQMLILDFLGTFKDKAVNCNVIVIAHIAYERNEDGNIVKGLPAGPGTAKNGTIPTYFNHTMVVKKGQTGARKLLTTGDAYTEGKTAAPGKVAKEYGVENGLAEYFAALRA